jgi:3-phenylpropionate/trans-cinnamate dioxygenase ferredoxin subunit
MAEGRWIEACKADAVGVDDVIDVDLEIGGEKRVIAVYRTGDGYFATDGICTHEAAYLAEGFVIDDVIECPMHNGRFNFKTGKALGAPVCIDLRTYPVKVEGGAVFVEA